MQRQKEELINNNLRDFASTNLSIHSTSDKAEPSFMPLFTESESLLLHPFSHFASFSPRVKLKNHMLKVPKILQQRNQKPIPF